VSRVRENRTHGSRWRREETGASRLRPRGAWRLPPTLRRGQDVAGEYGGEPVDRSMKKPFKF